MKPVAEGERKKYGRPKSGNGGNTSTMKCRREKRNFNQKPKAFFKDFRESVEVFHRCSSFSMHGIYWYCAM
jgi:hypothetical protein